MKIGITGCTSGLGKRLIEILLTKQNNIQLKALVRKTSNIEEISHYNLELYYGDIRDYNSLPEFIKDLDICFHLAAQVKYTDKRNFYDINICGTENICKSIYKYNPKCRLIYCSTISTLKVLPLLKFNSSTYAISKYYAEKKVVEYSKKNNLKTTIIYPGLIFGKYDNNFLPTIISLLKNNKIKLVRGGEKMAPIIYVDDLCELFIKTIFNDISIGKKYISVKGAEIGIHDFIKRISEKLNYRLPVKIYNKKLLFLYASLIESLYKIFKKNPPINKTLVNTMSINIKSYKKTYDDPEKELGWKQNIDKEFIFNKLDSVLSYY